MLVLASAKKAINVVVANNEEAIATKRRCSITFDNF
jgi:hypothetical protein